MKFLAFYDICKQYCSPEELEKFGTTDNFYLGFENQNSTFSRAGFKEAVHKFFDIYHPEQKERLATSDNFLLLVHCGLLRLSRATAAPHPEADDQPYAKAAKQAANRHQQQQTLQ